MITFPFRRSQIDQRQRRQGDQADAQYRRVRLDPTPNGPRCGSGSCAELPWRPPPFHDEVGVEGDGVGHSALVDQVGGPMRTQLAGSSR